MVGITCQICGVKKCGSPWFLAPTGSRGNWSEGCARPCGETSAGPKTISCLHQPLHNWCSSCQESGHYWLKPNLGKSWGVSYNRYLEAIWNLDGAELSIIVINGKNKRTNVLSGLPLPQLFCLSHLRQYCSAWYFHICLREWYVQESIAGGTSCAS